MRLGRKGRERRVRGKGKAVRWRANTFTDFYGEGWQRAVTEDVVSGVTGKSGGTEDADNWRDR
jgi:hypothetical protein